MSPAEFCRILERHARRRPSAIAIADDRDRVTYASLPGRIAQIARRLADTGTSCLGLLADNGVDWALADLGALAAGIPIVPLPAFFTDEQLRHAIDAAGIDLVLTDDVERVRELTGHSPTHAVSGLGLHASPAEPAHGASAHGASAHGACAHGGCGQGSKVTFTSGTTGTPKGVVLGAEGLLTVACSAARASRLRAGERHVATLPLAILLENVAGLYRPLLAGATAVLPALQGIGVDGACSADPARLLAALRCREAASVVLTPQVLEVLVDTLEHEHRPAPQRLTFAGVGGARTPACVLHRARAVGLSVYEGYGLSEASSIVALNTPRARRLGSVGRVLPHAGVRIADDGEVHVTGALFLGYLGDTSPARAEWPTGDLGSIDDDGFLFIRGRKRNVLITSHGRNVSPEWLEGLLTDGTAVREAVVVGDGRPGPAAVLRCGDVRLARAAVERVNRVLPDYARVRGFVLTHRPLTTTSASRLDIERRYRTRLDDVYRGAAGAAAR